MESEKDTEKYLRDEIHKIGGTAYKFVSPGNTGVPDRMICLPGGRVVFVELKSEGKRSTPKQKQQQDKLRALGFTVYADIDTKAKVDELIIEISRNAQMTIGECIRSKRELLGITQTELAMLTGYSSRSSINKIENGINDIPQSKLICFAKALNTTVSCLIGEGVEK